MRKCASDAHQCASAFGSACPSLIRTHGTIRFVISFFCLLLYDFRIFFFWKLNTLFELLFQTILIKHWWSSCTSTKPNQNNLSRQALSFQQEADEKVISQQANQTLWLFHNRQDQTLWLFFVAVPLVIPQCIQSQSCTEDGNGNPVLHTIPQQPQTSTLSSGSVA